ncbi:tyrosine-type recombinase/integrase [Chromobacterium vaccinii]|uniref:tyrosine-type recombinase/integrase n=1 Tax=Chromobacterium vaccinii TaxID=1108595 RepID=UPI000E201A13|nr:tyrosine-type recombinase/integrase [Chromobacterium vaccinii]
MGRRREKNLSLPQHMYQKGNSYYFVSRENGKYKWIPLGNDLAVARLEWAKLENIADVDIESVTFSVAAARFARDVMPEKAAKTQEEYTRQLRKLNAVFGNVPLDAITPQFVRRYLDERGAKVAANREKALLSTVFNHAREWGYTNAANPCAGVKGHRETGRDRYIEDAELLKVISCACRPLKDALELAYYTGQRPSDVRKLKRTDIREGALSIRQNKTKAALRVAIEGPLLDIIIRLTTELPPIEPGAVRTLYLVQDEKGQPLTKSNLHYRFTKARKLAGIPNFQFRDIRAKSATDTEEIAAMGHAQRLLGHKTRSMTEHYVKDRLGYRVAPTPKTLPQPKKRRA